MVELRDTTYLAITAGLHLVAKLSGQQANRDDGDAEFAEYSRLIPQILF